MNDNIPARAAALAAAAEVYVEPTALVAFASKGRVLILGPLQQALPAAQRLAAVNALECIVLADDAETVADTHNVPVIYLGKRRLELQGHLGAFEAILSNDQSHPVNLASLLDPQRTSFDLILDLSIKPRMSMEVPPLGYYAPAGEEALSAALAELPDMVGEFEKPRFFHYDPDICAHGQKGLSGCRRCLDACPTQAITSLVDRIEVDPFLCQGGGSCATTCPSGAISYRYPSRSDTLNRLRALLRTYREQGGQHPVLMFFGSDVDPDMDSWPGNLLPVQVEEIGSIGMEIWLAALAYGAGSVRIGLSVKTPPSVVRTIREQLGIAQVLLKGMGYSGQVLREQTPFPDELELEPLMPAITPAGFGGFDEKRMLLFMAVDHLYTQAPTPQNEIMLPAGAPFGEIRVDRDACTLCMGCVAVCPPFALSAGGDEPKLTLTEASCIQCGLCETACPEQAISRQNRFLYRAEDRRRQRVLNEESPFCCIRCGKPFATQAMIKTISAKLKEHWMYQDETALQRLQMCENCRVEAMFQDDTAAPMFKGRS